MKKALVNEATGAVENIIVLPDDPDPNAASYEPPAGSILIDNDGTAWIGGVWDGAAFQPPPLEETRAAAPPRVNRAARAAGRIIRWMRNR